MLEPSHETFAAITELCEIAAERSRPLVFWVGAGASRWAGVAGWAKLAEIVHQDFSRKEPNYPRDIVATAIDDGRFPEVFGACKRCSLQRYNSLLVRELMKCVPTAVYLRFISALSKITPCHIITTNADELLEQQLNSHVVLPSDFEAVPNLLAKQTGFVAKLHGSISQMDSLVFTDEEYARLAANETLLHALASVFERAVVSFVGYGLRDQYVLNLLDKVAGLNKLFGTGPHFALRSSIDSLLPASVRTIQYSAELHRDHRSVIQVVEEVGIYSQHREIQEHQSTPLLASGSIHMLSDLYPVGTWSTSQRVTLATPTGEKPFFYTGHGLTEREMPLTMSTAMHDLAVGLICFDRVLAPLGALGRTHLLLGGARFAELVNADVLRFARLRSAEMVIFGSDTPEIIGNLGSIDLPENRDRDGNEMPIRDLILRQIKPALGKEREAEAVFQGLEKQLIDPLRDSTVSVPRIVQNLLMRPSVREMIGMSGGVPVTAVPKWLMFPVLRLAQVVRLGLVCEAANVDSIKFEFGSDKLAGAAFSATFGEESAAQVASYVVAGSFNSDLGAYITENPEILNNILRFRDSKPGEALRKAMRDALSKATGGEISAAINGGLEQFVPSKVLQQARSQFARMSIVPNDSNYPAVWYDADNSTRALALWRRRSAAELASICTELRLDQYDRCPCGSGEKIRFCCGEVARKA